MSLEMLVSVCTPGIADCDEVCRLLVSGEDSMFGCSLKLKRLVEKGKKFQWNLTLMVSSCQNWR